MLGYRDPIHEWLGKFPARLDDVLNYVPARFTALLFTAAGKWMDPGEKSACTTIHLDAGKTDSPNAGYPMSAVAGVLGVELEKVGQYKLGEGNPPPSPNDIRKARKLLGLASGLGILFLLLLPLKKK
jgi:adenosylcobinamide-phosphate synthase